MGQRAACNAAWTAREWRRDTSPTRPRSVPPGWGCHGSTHLPSLDHILVNGVLADRVDYEVVRINSEFHDQVSDHDPQVLWLDTRRSTPPGRD